MDKKNVTDTQGYYSVMKKNEILPFMTACINLEGMMLYNRSDREWQILYDLTYMAYKIVELIETTDILVVIQGRGWDVWEMVKIVNRHKLPAIRCISFSYIKCSMATIVYNIVLYTWSITYYGSTYDILTLQWCQRDMVESLSLLNHQQVLKTQCLLPSIFKTHRKI